MKVFLWTYLFAAITVASMTKVIVHHRGGYEPPIAFVTAGAFWPIVGVAVTGVWLRGDFDQ